MSADSPYTRPSQPLLPLLCRRWVCRRRRVGLGIGTDGDAVYSSSRSTERRQTVSALPMIVRTRVGILSCDSVSSSLLPSVAEPRNRPHRRRHRHRNNHHHRYRHLDRPSPAIAHSRHACHSPASPSIVFSHPPARPSALLHLSHSPIPQFTVSFFFLLRYVLLLFPSLHPSLPSSTPPHPSRPLRLTFPFPPAPHPAQPASQMFGARIR